MKTTFIAVSAAVAFFACASSHAVDAPIAGLIQQRDALQATQKQLSESLMKEIQSHAELQVDKKCLDEIFAAQGKAENVTDQACLASWLETLKAGRALALQERPTFKEIGKNNKALEALNVKIIETLLSQKK
ncbi:MAG: hypothetical protein LCH26_03655 [Proteobacteria bacterium]|nr:hypothetical protein [Pseudomonadota bacterium]